MATRPYTTGRPSPDLNAAVDLFTFLAQRFEQTWSPNGLNCPSLVTGVNTPIVTSKDANGVAVDATFNLAGSPQPIAGKGNQRRKLVRKGGL